LTAANNGLSAVATLIAQAQAFVNSNPNAALFNQFAVVSGAVNPSGSLLAPGIQTYLVQVTPEPNSIFVLMSLSLALAWVASKKKLSRN
jgi:hypothetical protein